MVKYWPEKGKKGFIVWRYLFRRDDPSPAPWTEEGKARMEEQGISLVYPPGYLEMMAQKEKEKKRKAGEEDGDEEDEGDEEEDQTTSAPVKKKAKTVYSMSAEWKDLIEKDDQNVKIWKDVQAKDAANKKELTDYIEELFNCIICQVGSEELDLHLLNINIYFRTLFSSRLPLRVATTSVWSVSRGVSNQVGLYFDKIYRFIISNMTQERRTVPVAVLS